MAGVRTWLACMYVNTSGGLVMVAGLTTARTLICCGQRDGQRSQPGDVQQRCARWTGSTSDRMTGVGARMPHRQFRTAGIRGAAKRLAGALHRRALRFAIASRQQSACVWAAVLLRRRLVVYAMPCHGKTVLADQQDTLRSGGCIGVCGAGTAAVQHWQPGLEPPARPTQGLRHGQARQAAPNVQKVRRALACHGSLH